MERETITDAQWAAITPLLPPEPNDDQPANRSFTEGVLWLIRTGTLWQEWPRGLGDNLKAHQRMISWLKAGVWTKVYAQLPPMSEPAVALQDLLLSYYEDQLQQEPSFDEDPILVELANSYRQMKERARALLVELSVMSEDEKQNALRSYLRDLANTDISKYQVAYPENYLRIISKLEGNSEGR